MKLADSMEKPEGGIEVVSKRQERSKTFSMGNAKFRLVHSLGVIHYKENYLDVQGVWKEIELGIEDRGDKFVINKAPYNLVIFKDKVGFSYTSKCGGTIVVQLEEIDDVLLSNREDLNIVPRVDDSRIYWDNLVKDLDVYLEAKGSGCEIFKVLKTNKAPVKFKWLFVEDKQNLLNSNKDVVGWDSDRKYAKIKIDIKSVHLTEFKDKNCYTITEEFEKKVSVIKDKKTRIKEWIDDVKYPVTIDVPDITELIVNDVDDGFSYYGTDWRDDYLRFWVGHYYYPYDGGLRYRGVAVPQGATIDSANLKLKVASILSGALTKIYGDDVDDAVSWSNGNLPKDITKTDASATWNPTSTGWNTVDIKTIVQEIVNRGNWVSGNDMRFGIIHKNTGKKYVEVYDYHSGQANAAYIEIDYTIFRQPRGGTSLSNLIMV